MKEWNCWLCMCTYFVYSNSKRIEFDDQMQNVQHIIHILYTHMSDICDMNIELMSIWFLPEFSMYWNDLEFSMYWNRIVWTESSCMSTF